MTTADLYERWIDRFRGDTLTLPSGDLEALAPQLNVTVAVNALTAYFPDGTIRLTGLRPVSRPAPGNHLEVTGTASAPPFAGMPLRLEMWTEEQAGSFELHLTASACGTTPVSRWTLGPAIPFYQGSLLAGLRFALTDDPQYPFLTLRSHPGQGARPTVYFKGFADLNSIVEASPLPFIGPDARDKFTLVLGTIVAFDPWSSADLHSFRPYLSVFSGLPASPQPQKLFDLLPISNIRYALNATPDYNLATYKWEPSASSLWSADLELMSGSGSRTYKVPFGVQVERKRGGIRLWSDLTDGLALTWDALAQALPGVPSQLPDTGFQLQDAISLTNLEISANRTPDGGLTLESISLNVQTNEDTNRWVLIDGLLTLNAIDFFIVVHDPLRSPAVTLILSGLIGIGEKAVLQLTADLSLAEGQTDFGFSGRLLDDEPLYINEVLTHFLGHSNFPTIPNLAVEDFSFSVRPRSKLYDGELKLSANWPLTSTLSLRNVYFKMHHDAGEADTTFEANGVFLIGDTQIYVSADYVSNGQGWTFSGGTFDDEEIPIGEWLSSAWSLCSQSQAPALPAALKDLVLLNLGVSFNTTTGNYSFQGTARFPIDGKTDGKTDGQTNAELTVQVDREGDSASFCGTLTLLERDFSVAFHSSGLLVATYDGSGAKSVDLKELVSGFSQTIGDAIAPGISINLSRAQLAFARDADPSRFLFGVDLDTGIQLSNLPVVGFLFDHDQTLNVAFQLLAARGVFESDEIKAINTLTGSEVTKLPSQRIGGAKPGEPEFRLTAAVTFGGFTQQVAMPFHTDVASTPQSGKLPVVPSTRQDAYWVKIDRTLGPFHFQRLGITTDGTNLAFLMDARLETAGLTITLDGLAARCTFADLTQGTFHPSFDLQGLGVSFKSGDLEIGGALVRRPAPARDAFDGAMVIRYKRLCIEAVGSYETLAGQQPSLFIYALINYPLGGPAFFFVEGGAVGFGYNRSFTMPTIDRVAEFPLIQQALSPSASRLKPMQLAEQLRPYLTPVAGQYFITAGIKFSSFKTINGFVLLTVLFGDHFEIDVLGKATLTSPSGAESGKALMSATLLLLGRFLPEEGLLMVMAQLGPDSHLFAPGCHLTGGFALYCWFDGKNKGDFVLTLGGYHKSFAVPGHYPKVPRLGMNWQVNSNLSLKAEAYFAITPSALMAGGRLEANWQSGDLQAWFRAEVDFLIGWQPFYYDGHAYVAIGARYRFNFFGQHEISAELTAELDVWGPPFSGRARVHWNLISFEITFGDRQPSLPDPLAWPAFRKAFLPEGRMFTMTAEGGKVAQSRSNDATDLGCLNPRNLCLAVRSPLPVKLAGNNLLKNALESPAKTPVTEPLLGIAPMNRPADKWNSIVTVTIVHDGTGKDATEQFQAVRIRSNVPSSLWGETMDPKARKKDAPQLLNDAVCGYEIRPINPVTIKPPTGFAVSATSRATTLNRPLPAQAIARTTAADVAKEVAASLLKDDVRKRRNEILKSLLPEVDPDWGSVTTASWRGTPTLVRVKG